MWDHAGARSHLKKGREDRRMTGEGAGPTKNRSHKDRVHKDKVHKDKVHKEQGCTKTGSTKVHKDRVHTGQWSRNGA
jgi:hypothetical protein